MQSTMWQCLSPTRWQLIPVQGWRERKHISSITVNFKIMVFWNWLSDAISLFIVFRLIRRSRLVGTSWPTRPPHESVWGKDVERWGLPKYLTGSLCFHEVMWHFTFHQILPKHKPSKNSCQLSAELSCLVSLWSYDVNISQTNCHTKWCDFPTVFLFSLVIVVSSLVNFDLNSQDNISFVHLLPLIFSFQPWHAWEWSYIRYLSWGSYWCQGVKNKNPLVLSWVTCDILHCVPIF